MTLAIVAMFAVVILDTPRSPSVGGVLFRLGTALFPIPFAPVFRGVTLSISPSILSAVTFTSPVRFCAKDLDFGLGV